MKHTKGARNKRSKRRLSAAERREQLIQVSLQLFSSNGFDGTTTREIAESAGISEALIFRHFRTKEDLYAAILERKAEEGGTGEWLKELRECADRKDDEGVIRALVLKILESYRRDAAFQRVMHYASLERHDIARISQQTLGLPVYGFLRDYIRERQGDGEFRRQDPGVVVFALVGMPIYYAIVRWLFEVDLLEAADEEIAGIFTGLLLNGLRAGTEGGNRRGRLGKNKNNRE